MIRYDKAKIWKVLFFVGIPVRNWHEWCLHCERFGSKWWKKSPFLNKRYTSSFMVVVFFFPRCFFRQKIRQENWEKKGGSWSGWKKSDGWSNWQCLGPRRWNSGIEKKQRPGSQVDLYENHSCHFGMLEIPYLKCSFCFKHPCFEWSLDFWGEDLFQKMDVLQIFFLS